MIPVETIDVLGLWWVFGMLVGGLAVGSGIYRGLRKIGWCLVRASKIISNAMTVPHSSKYIYYSNTEIFNDAKEKDK